MGRKPEKIAARSGEDADQAAFASRLRREGETFSSALMTSGIDSLIVLISRFYVNIPVATIEQKPKT